MRCGYATRRLLQDNADVVQGTAPKAYTWSLWSTEEILFRMLLRCMAASAGRLFQCAYSASEVEPIRNSFCPTRYKASMKRQKGVLIRLCVAFCVIRGCAGGSYSAQLECLGVSRGDHDASCHVMHHDLESTQRAPSFNIFGHGAHSYLLEQVAIPRWLHHCTSCSLSPGPLNTSTFVS